MYKRLYISLLLWRKHSADKELRQQNYLEHTPQSEDCRDIIQNDVIFLIIFR
jgi:hypothetical protein